MKKSKIAKVLLIVLVVLIITACNLPFGIGSKDSNDQGSDVAEVSEETEEAISLSNLSDEPDPNPVALQEGLGSFDTYQLNIFLKYSSSDGSFTEVNEFTERSVIDNNTHSILTNVSYDPKEDSEPNNSTTETYIVGNVTCNGEPDDWEYSEMTSQEKELMDILKGMVDFVPIMDNPVFVGEENVNGIDCNHFTFTVSGIGDTSGSVATINSGDYWLAKDGQYIVKYHLLLEVQSAADGSTEAETTSIEASIDLNSVNLPLTFTLPANCQPETE